MLMLAMISFACTNGSLRWETPTFPISLRAENGLLIDREDGIRQKADQRSQRADVAVRETSMTTCFRQKNRVL